MNRALSPGPSQICGNAAFVQHLGESRFEHFFFHEHAVHPTNDLHFLGRPWNENDAVCLYALLLSPVEHSLVLAAHVTQHPAKPKPWRATLTKSEFDKATLPDKNLGGKLAAVLTSHGPLHTLNDCRNGAAVILKLLSAIVHIDLCASANVLVIGALVRILEASPTADIVDKNCVKVSLAILYIMDQLF